MTAPPEHPQVKQTCSWDFNRNRIIRHIIHSRLFQITVQNVQNLYLFFPADVPARNDDVGDFGAEWWCRRPASTWGGAPQGGGRTLPPALQVSRCRISPAPIAKITWSFSSFLSVICICMKSDCLPCETVWIKIWDVSARTVDLQVIKCEDASLLYAWRSCSRLSWGQSSARIPIICRYLLEGLGNL